MTATTTTPRAQAALLENLTNKEGGGPFDAHDPVGWPTFTDWPKWSSLTHQQMYYKWVERAWRGGLRVLVADAVNNNVLCSLPTQANRYSCDDMDTVRRQIAETKTLAGLHRRAVRRAGSRLVPDRLLLATRRGQPCRGGQARRRARRGDVEQPFGCKQTLRHPGVHRGPTSTPG